MEVRDLEVHQRLATLIERACTRSNPALDATLLAGIKALCKQSDFNVAVAWEALWGHLRAPHSQVGGGSGPASAPVLAQPLPLSPNQTVLGFTKQPLRPVCCRRGCLRCWCVSSCSAAAGPSARRC